MSINKSDAPVRNIHLIGRAENEVMPSIEKLNIFERGYFVSPATRGLRAYVTIAVYKPIKGIIPLKNRFCSPYSDSKFSARLLIKR